MTGSLTLTSQIVGTKTDPKSIYFKQLDGLRCLAVTAVMICHWITYRQIVVIPFGSTGVNLFFVLSGFLITRILLMDKMVNSGSGRMYDSIKRFYIRRSLRIFPIYYATLLILIIAGIAPAKQNAAWLLTYTANIKFALPGVWESNTFSYLGHLWSLSVEEQFYIFFPFVIWICSFKHLRPIFVLMIASGVLSRLFLVLTSAPLNGIYVLTPCCLDSFGLGALLAYYLLFEPQTLSRTLGNNLAFLTLMFLFGAVTWYSRNFMPAYGECRTVSERLLFSLCCFWIVGKGALGSYKGWFKTLLECKWVIYLGKISYGMYVYHGLAEPVYKQLGPLHDFLAKTPHVGIAARFVILFSITVVVSSISWYLIEQPFIKLKSKI